MMEIAVVLIVLDHFLSETEKKHAQNDSGARPLKVS